MRGRLGGMSPFILMTATFSQEMLKRLASELGAEAILLTEDELLEIPAQRKERSFFGVEEPLIRRQEGLEGGFWAVNFDLVLGNHEAQLGAFKRSLVVFNQVERAQRFYQALCEAVPAGVEVRLLHSRFRQVDRERIEGEIEREFGKEKGRYEFKSLILVATQVVEVGLDMTCGALHTELAPAASLLQRAGRCARYVERGQPNEFRNVPSWLAGYQIRPADFVRGFHVAFYKVMGKAVVMMNVAFLNLPGWVVINSSDALRRLNKVLGGPGG